MRWVALKKTSPSGKSLFVCTVCGRTSIAPDKRCPEGCEEHDREYDEKTIRLVIRTYHDSFCHPKCAYMISRELTVYSCKLFSQECPGEDSAELVDEYGTPSGVGRLQRMTACIDAEKSR